MFFAIEDIKSGEELTFDYNWELKAVSKDMFEKSATKCKCGKLKCHIYVGYKTEKFTLPVLLLTVLVRVTVLVR